MGHFGLLPQRLITFLLVFTSDFFVKFSFYNFSERQREMQIDNWRVSGEWMS